MRIGFFIKDQSKLFANGCNQQVLFVYKTLKHVSGVQCSLFTHNSGLTDFLGIPTFDFSTLRSGEHSVDVLIFLSKFVIQNEILDSLQKKKIKLIFYNCGNLYYVLKEDVVFGVHNYNLDISIFKYLHELWNIPNYPDDEGFYKAMYGKTPKIAPYVWDPSIVEQEMMSDRQSLHYHPPNHLEVQGVKYLIIAEPNAQTTKCCLIPLLICETYYQLDRNIRVILLSTPKHKAFHKFLSKLSIFQGKKVECYGRIKLFEVIRQLKKKNTSIFFISHQHKNALNFLHLEVMYLGYPLIHNTSEYKGSGYFYNTVQEGAEKLLVASGTHRHTLSDYKLKVKETLYRFSPQNPVNITSYRKLLGLQ